MKLRMFTGLAVIFTMCLLLLTGCTKSYDAKELCDIEVNGMNGYASVSAEVNFDKMLNIIHENSKNEEEALSLMFGDGSDVSFNILSDNKNLSNGDKVEIELIYDKKAAAKYGIAFKNAKFTYKITGLKDPKVIDPFKGLKIEYIGVSPQASVTFNKTGCDKFVNDNVNFTTESNTAANGESIAVKVYYDSQNAEMNGIVLSPEEKTFEVSGVPEYPSDISKCKLTGLEEQFRTEAESKTALNGFTLAKSIEGNRILGGSFNDKWEIKSIEYTPVKKMYFYAKDIKNEYIKNNYYILWEVKITSEKTSNYDNKWFEINSDYKIGDKFTVSQHVETYCQNFSADSEGVINLQDSNFGSQYYKKDSGEAIISEWKSKNVAKYNVSELE